MRLRQHRAPPRRAQTVSNSSLFAQASLKNNWRRSRLAADAAHDLLDGRVALDDGEQTSVEDRPHAVGDSGPFERALIEQ